MRRLALALTAAALLPVGLLTSPATGSATASVARTDPGAFEVVVEPAYCGQYVPVCETSLTTDTGSAYTNERTSVSASLQNLATGAAVGLDYSPYPSEDFVFEVAMLTQNVTLPPGAYQLTMTTSTPGKYGCSEYYEDGCIWLDDDVTTTSWRFNYDGVSVSAHRAYVAPTTKFVGDRVVSRRDNKYVATGRVVGNVEQADYSLAPSGPLSGRKVTLEVRKSSGKFRLVKAGRTNANGKFKIKVTPTVANPRRWRLTVAPATGSPGAAVSLLPY